jgi:hypothetical protein
MFRPSVREGPVDCGNCGLYLLSKAVASGFSLLMIDRWLLDSPLLTDQAQFHPGTALRLGHDPEIPLAGEIAMGVW